MNKVMNKLLNIALFLGAGLAFCACSNEDDSYEVGPQTPDNCITAYFSNSNETAVVMSSDDFAADPTITLTVSREKADEAVTVPVIAEYGDAAFQIPSSVSFAAGESTANLTISFPTLQPYVEAKYSIRLGDDYVNHYAQVDGSDRFVGSVLVSRWDVVTEEATCYPNNCFTTYRPVSAIYHLAGQNRFKMTNFFGTGLDINFKIDASNFDPDDSTSWVGEFVPLDHYKYDNIDGKVWWVMNDENDYAGFDLDDGTHIYYMNFYCDDSSYSWFRMSKLTSSGNYYLTLCAFMYTSEDDGEWNYLYWYWKPQAQ